MNMLENKTELGLMNGKDKQLFIDCDRALLEKYVCALDADWYPIREDAVIKSLINTTTYRLRLVKGAYYTIKYKGLLGVLKFDSYMQEMEVDAPLFIKSSLYLGDSGTLYADHRTCRLDFIDSIRPATEAEKKELMDAFEKTIYPKNPMEGWPPIFVCPCGNLAAIQMSVNKEVIQRTPEPDDEYKSWDMGNINGTIVCAKCKTKMTYNIETPLGG